MKDEIKEILNKWKCYIELTKKFTTNEYEMLRVEDIDKILDYITNLQEEKDSLDDYARHLHNENKRLKEVNEEHRKINGELREENKRLKEIIKENTILVKDENGNYQECNINPLDYKARIDKAIEYIKSLIENSKPDLYNDDLDDLHILLNILKGKSDE